ncbi:hypothetical protein [Intrasporangium sp. YIM S08009]|uniref:hypothetical protein n=1 Tax=Intrasporangium zincisolvens TaxID=3080018 RepID=UPI002B053F28|nr:hypothetical protein [Intrasporangium sp. YIM S08009]
MILHLRAAVEELYAESPSRFTARRSELAAQAKAAGDKQLAAAVTALRKPTVAAWAVNHFVRTCRDEVDELRSFAELLREAQRTLDADQLRLLGRERSRRVDAVADRVAEEAASAGQRVGAGVALEVRDTLTALIADEDAEASVLTGALVKALSYSGFGSVDLEDALALEDLPRGHGAGRPSLSVLDGGGGDAIDLEERRRARRTAERTRLVSALEGARESLRSADRHVAVLTAREEEVTEGIADLERRLAAARERLVKVGVELAGATSERDAHEAHEAKARRALEDHDAAE